MTSDDARWRFCVTRDPWFNLGLHIDHRAPYVALHFPGFRVIVGRTQPPVYSRDVGEDMWLLSYDKITRDMRDRVRRAVER